MRVAPWIDKATRPLRRRVARATAPTSETLGHPLFSEQIAARKQRWIALGPENTSKKLCSKLGGQDFVRSLGYPVPEVYARFPRITALPPLNEMPERFVLKPEHGHSVSNVFLLNRGVSLLHGKPMTRDDIIASVGPDFPGLFIAEELLMHHDGLDQNANDVKFYLFGGKVALVVMIERRSSDPRQNRYWFLTEDWQLFPFRVSLKIYAEKRLPPMPACYPETLAIARDIGRRLNTFVRLDMYVTSRGPVFGEFTHYPNFGRNFTPRADAWLGSLWKGVEGCEPPSELIEMEPLRQAFR